MQARITTINIDSTAMQRWIVELARIHKSAFPIAIRRTLNEVVLYTKQVTMPQVTDRDFKKRKPTFWRATSHVEFASGFNVNTMAAIVGFTAPQDKKESGHATQDLEEQEAGGSIDKRAFIAEKGGRTVKGNVRDKYSMAYINSRMSVKTRSSIVDSLESQGKNSPEKFIRAAIAAGKGGFVLGTDRKNGARALLVINSIHRLTTGRTVVNSTPIYSVRAKRKAYVKATHFMAESAQQSAGKMEVMFMRNVQKEIEKVRKT